jgi:hypothetical protein
MNFQDIGFAAEPRLAESGVGHTRADFGEPAVCIQ